VVLEWLVDIPLVSGVYIKDVSYQRKQTPRLYYPRNARVKKEIIEGINDGVAPKWKLGKITWSDEDVQGKIPRSKLYLAQAMMLHNTGVTAASRSLVQ
jgi:hypothetical protein